MAVSAGERASGGLLHLIASAGYGGAEVYVENAVRAAGGDVLALSSGPMVARWKAAGAHVTLLPAPGKFPYRAIAPLRAAIEAGNPRLLLTHATKASLLGSLAAPPEIPRAVFVHGSHRQYAFARTVPAGAYRLADKIASRRAKFVVAVTRRDAEELAMSGFPAERIRVIPPAVPAPPDGSAGAGERPDGVLWLGRLSHEKNPEAFIEIVRKIREAGTTSIHARLVGDGPLREKIAHLASGSGVEIHAAAHDPEAHYAASGILVLTSLSEGLPLAVLEAAARGMAMLLPDLPGLREAMGEAGAASGSGAASAAAAFYPAGRYPEAACALAGLLADSGRRKALGAAARARYETEYRIERLAEDLRGLEGDGVNSGSHS